MFALTLIIRGAMTHEAIAQFAREAGDACPNLFATVCMAKIGRAARKGKTVARIERNENGLFSVVLA